MFKTLIWSALGVVAAVTLPAIVFSTADSWKKGDGKSSAAAPAASTSAAAPAPAPAVPGVAPPTNQAAATLPPAMRIEGSAPRDLAEVLRFDITPDWIVSRWPRVSTGLAHLQLQGYRVPLVTGTAPTDLAGALTYYYTSQQQLQRITFRGATGDARNLVAFVAARYHLTRRLANDPALLVYEAVDSSNKPTSALRLRAAPILKANEPYSRFDVELVLERPEE